MTVVALVCTRNLTWLPHWATVTGDGEWFAGLTWLCVSVQASSGVPPKVARDYLALDPVHFDLGKGAK